MKREYIYSIAFFLGLTPILLMLYSFNKYAVNIPHWDDHALKAFVINLQSTSSYTQKLKELFAQHNEHRIVFTRLITWVIFKLNGSIDFRIMMLVGNSSLLGIWAYFISCINKYKLSAWYISVSGWLLFSYAISENIFWGMASVQNFWVILWAFSTFYLLAFGEQKDIDNPFIKQHKGFIPKNKVKRWMLYLAIATSLIAVFTSGNGIVVPFIGAFILLVQKRFRTSILWLSILVIPLLLYIITLAHRPDPINDKTVGINALINGVTILSGAIFDTDWFSPTKRFLVTQAVGGLLIIGSFILFSRRLFVTYFPESNNYIVQKRKTDLFMSACLLFIAGTIVGIVLSRHGYGTGVFLTGKYKIYSILLLIICILYSGRLLHKKFRKIGIITAVTISILLWVNSYLNDYQFVLNQTMQRKVDLANWKMEAQKSGYQLSDYPYKAPINTIFEGIDLSKAEKDKTLIDNIELKNDEVVFYENDLEAVKQRVYFILKSDNQTYFYSTKPQRNKSRIRIFLNYFQKGFTVNVSRQDVKTDFYTPYVLIKTNKNSRLITNNKLIRIDGVAPKAVEKNW